MVFGVIFSSVPYGPGLWLSRGTTETDKFLLTQIILKLKLILGWGNTLSSSAMLIGVIVSGSPLDNFPEAVCSTRSYL